MLKSVNFPHSLEAMDNKNCVLQGPLNSGSKFYNHKSVVSCALFAMVIMNYCFLFVNDAGCERKISDVHMFRSFVNTSLIVKKNVGVLGMYPLYQEKFNYYLCRNSDNIRRKNTQQSNHVITLAVVGNLNESSDKATTNIPKVHKALRVQRNSPNTSKKHYFINGTQSYNRRC